jgi:drug/metabolite transporter (DMT)-like permease
MLNAKINKRLMCETVFAVPITFLFTFGAAYFVGLLFAGPILMPVAYAVDTKGSFIMAFIIYNGLAFLAYIVCDYCFYKLGCSVDAVLLSALIQLVSLVFFVFAFFEIHSYFYR